ncbi:MAG: oxidoreductase [bacterium]
MLNGQVVIVTGGAGFLGKEFIKTIVCNGGIGIVADMDEPKGRQAVLSLKKELNIPRLEYVNVDITSKKSIARMINYLDKKYNRIDAVVNNAYPRNKNFGRKFELVAYKDFCENVSMHLGGYFLVSQQLSTFFKKQGIGNIINISSIYGVVPPKFEIYEKTKMTVAVEYTVIKSAIIHLTKYMANYFKGLNIRVNCISPGGIFNKQPAKFLKNYRSKCLSKGMLDRSDLNGTLLFLLSDMSTFMNGQNIIVDDGFVL